MVEVDPFVLVGVGVAVVGVVGMALYNSSKISSKPSSDEAEFPLTKASSKPKKKSKSSKSNKASKPTNVDASSASEWSGEDVANMKKETKKETVSNDKGTVSKSSSVAALKLPAAKVIEEIPEPPAPTPAPTAETTTNKTKKGKETVEQKAARLERRKAEAAEAKQVSQIDAKKLNNSEPDDSSAEVQDYLDEAALTSLRNGSVAPTSYDGWAIVGDKSDKKKKNKSDAEDGADLPTEEETEDIPTSSNIIVEEIKAPAPVEDYVTEDIEVETKKMGLLIGPKGVTKMGIQNITGAEINMPKVDRDVEKSATISVSGTSSAVKGALKAIKELVTKGYATILTPENFVEGQVTVHPRNLADVIGKSGSTIKAIMNATGVKITTPPNVPKLNGRGEPLTKVKIGLAGVREQVSVARNTILELCKYGHTAMTHPNLIHKEIDVAESYYNYIIGAKGSEIKHIQANYKVTVTIPGDDTPLQNVLIVGEPGNVDSAEKHILRLIEKVETQAAERAANTASEQKSFNANATTAKPERERAPRPPRQEPEEPLEPWMKEFTQPRSQLNLSSLLPNNFAPSESSEAAAVPAPTVSTNGDASEIMEVVGPSISKSTAPPVPSGSWGSPLPQPFL